MSEELQCVRVPVSRVGSVVGVMKAESFVEVCLMKDRSLFKFAHKVRHITSSIGG